MGAVIGATGSHTENKVLDQEENNQPERQEAFVASETLSSSQGAGIEVQPQSAEHVEKKASTNMAGHTVTLVKNTVC